MISGICWVPSELMKLGLQLLGTLFIAWLTVHWALGRFKSEKMWERQSTALSEVLQAITEMDRINAILYDAELTHREIPDQAFEKLRDRKNAARKQFEQVSAIASIVLPLSAALTIDRIEHDLEIVRDSSNYDCNQGQLDAECGALRRARDDLVHIGRSLSQS